MPFSAHHASGVIAKVGGVNSVNSNVYARAAAVSCRHTAEAAV